MSGPMKYTVTEIEVSGANLRSILDMLRYDNCVPATEADAGKLERLCYDSALTTVRLRMFVPVGNKKEPTYARWESFGWRVVSVGGKPVL